MNKTSIYHNGFYSEKDYMEGENCNTFEWMDMIDSVYETIDVSVVSPYSFLHGYCFMFALALNKIYGYPIVLFKNPDYYIHAFCEVKQEDRTLYIDVRGITTDINELFEEFEDDIDITNISEDISICKNFSYSTQIKKLNEYEKESVREAEDIISDNSQIYDIKKFDKLFSVKKAS